MAVPVYAVDPLRSDVSPTGASAIAAGGDSLQALCGQLGGSTWSGDPEDYCTLPAGGTTIIDSPYVYVENASGGTRTYSLGISVSRFNLSGGGGGSNSTTNFCTTSSVSNGFSGWVLCTGSFDITASSSDSYVAVALSAYRNGGGSVSGMRLATFDDSALFSLYPSSFSPSNVWLVRDYSTDLISLVPPDECLSGSTRICYTFPYDDLVTASSTSFEAIIEGYVASADLSDDQEVEFVFDFYRMQNRLGVGPLNAFSGFSPNSEVIKIQGGTGYNYVIASTSALTLTGDYRFTASIRRPFISVFGFDLGYSTLSTDVVYFTVGTSTALEQFLEQGSDDFNDLLENATSTQAINDSCSIFTNFQFFTCVTNIAQLLFIPNDATVADLQGKFDQLKQKAPWGYGFVAYSSLASYGSTTATTSLSNLALTFPASSTIVQSSSTSQWSGVTLTFIDWAYMSTQISGGAFASFLNPLNFILNFLFTLGFAFWLWRHFNKDVNK